jgi:hypothetical protein
VLPAEIKEKSWSVNELAKSPVLDSTPPAPVVVLCFDANEDYKKGDERVLFRFYSIKPNRTLRQYTGLTDDLEFRLKAHNSGQVPHTSKFRPWKIETAVRFSCR